MARLQLSADAQAEAEVAIDWYLQRSPAVAHRFRSALREAMARAREAPQQFRKVDERARRVRVRGFPYSVFFRESADAILVFAIHHDRQDPRRWTAGR